MTIFAKHQNERFHLNNFSIHQSCNSTAYWRKSLLASTLSSQAASKLELDIFICVSLLQGLLRFKATPHQFRPLSSGNKLESWARAKIHGAFSEHFGSQNYGRLFPLWAFILCYAWPSSPPVTLKMKTTCSLLFMEIHRTRRRYPFFPPAVPFLFLLGKTMLFFAWVAILWTVALPLNSQEDNHLHWLHWFLSVG